MLLSTCNIILATVIWPVLIFYRFPFHDLTGEILPSSVSALYAYTKRIVVTLISWYSLRYTREYETSFLKRKYDKQKTSTLSPGESLSHISATHP